MVHKKRPIDANALKEKKIQAYTYDKEDGNQYFDIVYVRHIDEAPTVDAKEVVHGGWVVCGDGEYVPFMCSACGKTTSWYHKQTANYCPNCGAKMDW